MVIAGKKKASKMKMKNVNSKNKVQEMIKQVLMMKRHTNTLLK